MIGGLFAGFGRCTCLACWREVEEVQVWVWDDEKVKEEEEEEEEKMMMSSGHVQKSEG